MPLKPSDLKSSRPAADGISYGPFKIRLGLLIGASTATVLGLILILFSLTRDTLTCHRTSATTGTCTLKRRAPWGSQLLARFPIENIKEVRWVAYRGNKNSKMGKTLVIFKSGRTLVMADASRDRARPFYERFHGFYTNPTRRDITVVKAVSPLLLLLGLFMALFFSVAAILVLRLPRRATITFDRAAGTLLVRYKGVLGGKGSNVVSVRSPRALRFEQGHANIFIDSASKPGPLGHRILIVEADGREEPLTEQFLPARPAVHERAAAELSVILGLSSATATGQATAPDQAGFPSRDESPAPWDGTAYSSSTETAKKPWWKRPGIIVAMVVGTLVGLSMLLQVLLVKKTMAHNGRLTVICTERCRFGPTDCQPGGKFSNTYKPGIYYIQVWNPNAPGDWERIPVTVRRGRTTVFECRRSRPKKMRDDSSPAQGQPARAR